VGLTFAKICEKVALCDAHGARKLLGIALLTLAASKSLSEAMQDAGHAAHGLLSNWLRFINDKALLPLWISQEHATKAVLESHHRPQYRSGAAHATTAPGPMSSRRTAPKSDYTDTPASFKWCSSCHSATHSLLNCFSLPDRFANATARGQDPEKFLATLLQEHKAKWSKKGPQFAAAYRSHPPCSAKQLRAKLLKTKE